MSRSAERDARLDVTVAHGGHPDEATLSAIGQAVRTVLAVPASAATVTTPAWRRAARIEALGARRVHTLVALSADVRS